MADWCWYSGISPGFKNLLCLWSFPSDWLQGSLLSFYLECVSWRREGRVEKQGFSIFSYINFLSATTEEAFIANARPYKFVGQLKYPATQIDKNLSTKYFLKSNGQMCFSQAYRYCFLYGNFLLGLLSFQLGFCDILSNFFFMGLLSKSKSCFLKRDIQYSTPRCTSEFRQKPISLARWKIMQKLMKALPAMVFGMISNLSRPSAK